MSSSPTSLSSNKRPRTDDSDGKYAPKDGDNGRKIFYQKVYEMYWGKGKEFSMDIFQVQETVYDANMGVKKSFQLFPLPHGITFNEVMVREEYQALYTDLLSTCDKGVMAAVVCGNPGIG